MDMTVQDVAQNVPKDRDAIMNAAEEMVRVCGYACTTSEAIAAATGIPRAAILELYPQKEDLARDLAARYRRRFKARLDMIDVEDPVAALETYGAMFALSAEEDGFAGLGGMIAEENDELPASVFNEARLFFFEQSIWLADIFAALGQNHDDAREFLATLEDALRMARSVEDPSVVRRVTELAVKIAVTKGAG